MKTLFSCSAVLLVAFTSVADPTRPASSYRGITSTNSVNASPASALRVQMIQHSKQDKTAIINGSLLQLGDQYQGYTLIEINATAVVLSRGQERRILQLHNKMIKNYDK